MRRDDEGELREVSMTPDFDGQPSARSPREEVTYDGECILRNEANAPCKDLTNEVTYDGECILRNELSWRWGGTQPHENGVGVLA